MANVKLKLREINKLMTSQPVVSEVAARAARVRRAAGDGFVTIVKPHRYTARAFVMAETDSARRRQAKDAVLERAIDAAR